MIKFRFPDGFLFGTGSSAFQIEGSPYADGKGENTWDYSVRNYPEKFYNNAKTEPASHFYTHYKEDIEEMRRQGLKSFRFSISWARIMPEGRGRVNPLGIAFYNDVIDRLIAAGIEPFVDIFHWDLPQALAEIGGFKNPDIIEYFVEYARVCFESFGDRVKLWSTVNEPTVFCTAPYVDGRWYPFETDIRGALLASHNTLICHFRTVKLYREMGLKGKIGAVIDVVPVYPKDPTGKDVLAAQYQFERGSGWWLYPMFRGHYPENIIRDCDGFRAAMPEGAEEEIAREFVPMDFLGMNYYYPGFAEYDESSIDKSTRVESYYVQEGQYFALYPIGLYDAVNFVTREFGRPEIYITENGLGLVDSGNKEEILEDDVRISYLREHLRMIVRSIEGGADVRGYYYWSNFDSLEATSGYRFRFGFYYVDFETGERTRKKSWEYYRRIISTSLVD